MRVKILLSSVLVLLVIDSALGCLCLRNRGMCNCLPRARLWRPRPRNIVAVIQPLPQDQLVNPNICRCGRPLLRPINPILPPDFSDSLQDFNQPAFGARCLCTKQPEDIDCLPSNDLPTTIPWSPQILPNRPMLHPRLAPEILPPADLLPGTPFWTVNEEGIFNSPQEISHHTIPFHHLMIFLKMIVKRKKLSKMRMCFNTSINSSNQVLKIYLDN
uniref:Putative secreted protein n=1 Tax=Lutzomyia longipalpis TaxID=7200 RepID=A0A1B0GHM5_LUTLO